MSSDHAGDTHTCHDVDGDTRNLAGLVGILVMISTMEIPFTGRAMPPGRRLPSTDSTQRKAQEDFKELQAAKVAQIESGKKKLDEMEAEHSENEKFLSDAKEDIALTRQQRAEDVEFLRNLKAAGA